MKIQYCSDLHMEFHENMRFMKSLPIEPVGDVLNAAYATELGNYIADSRIEAWIYGHSHHPTDMMIGNTHLVSNPLGYVFCGENANFNDSALIEV